MSVLNVRVSPTRRDGEERWQGTVSLPGCRPTKLVRQADESTEFSTRSAVISSARTFAKRLNFELTLEEPTVTRKSATKRTVRAN